MYRSVAALSVDHRRISWLTLLSGFGLLMCCVGPVRCWAGGLAGTWHCSLLRPARSSRSANLPPAPSTAGAPVGAVGWPCWDASSRRVGLLVRRTSGSVYVEWLEREGGLLLARGLIAAPRGAEGIQWAGPDRVLLWLQRTSANPHAIQLENILTGQTSMLAHGFLPLVDPSGRTFAYVDSKMGLHVYDIRRRLDRAVGGRPGLIIPESLAWAPDGHALAFLRRPFGGLGYKLESLVAPGLSTSRVASLWSNPGAVYVSPGVGWLDSQHVLFATGNRRRSTIHALALAGGAPRVLSHFDVEIQPIGSMMWLSDGILAFAANRSATLYLMLDVQSGAARHIRLDCHCSVEAFAFSPSGHWLLATSEGGSHLYIENTATDVITQSIGLTWPLGRVGPSTHPYHS